MYNYIIFFGSRKNLKLEDIVTVNLVFNLRNQNLLTSDVIKM